MSTIKYATFLCATYVSRRLHKNCDPVLDVFYTQLEEKALEYETKILSHPHHLDAGCAYYCYFKDHADEIMGSEFTLDKIILFVWVYGCVGIYLLRKRWKP